MTKPRPNGIPDTDDESSSGDESGSEGERIASEPPSPHSDAKQHAAAILIAIVAAVVTFFQTHNSSFSRGANIKSSEYVPPRNYTPHHAGYRRTAGLLFCPLSLSDKNGTSLVDLEDENVHLRPFDFRFAKELLPALLAFYEEDQDAEREISGREVDLDSEHACVLEFLTSGDKSFKGYSHAYVAPVLSSLYRLKPPVTHRPGKTIEAIPTSFTGFAAKFWNLSNKPLLLYWDGKAKPSKIGEVAPFESIGTASTPGNTFYFSRPYSKREAVQRFVVTADDPILYHDPLRDAMHEGLDPPFRLSPEEKLQYNSVQLNMAYGRDYLVKTQRSWLGTFPRPRPMHYMHPADYFGQKHTITTTSTHFTSLPPADLLPKLTYEDYTSKGIPPLSNHRKLSSNGESKLSLTMTTLSVSPRVFEIPNFLSDVEVDHILHLSTDLPFEPSTTNSNPITKGEEDPTVRTSTNAWVYRQTSPIIDAIYRRASDVLKIDESLLRHRDPHKHTNMPSDHSIAEALQLVRYTEGQEYTPHHDFHYPKIGDRFQPTRFATILIYLNDGFEGGETGFPRAVTAEFHEGISVMPQKGKAVLFYNMLEDGNMDDLSQHSGMPVREGEKWMANLWVWDPVIS